MAHALAKDLSEPLRNKTDLEADLPLDGSDPLDDRDEVHEIYAEWRQVLDAYEPPRTAVAEACSAPERRHLYALPTGLGRRESARAAGTASPTSAPTACRCPLGWCRSAA